MRLSANGKSRTEQVSVTNLRGLLCDQPLALFSRSHLS